VGGHVGVGVVARGERGLVGTAVAAVGRHGAVGVVLVHEDVVGLGALTGGKTHEGVGDVVGVGLGKELNVVVVEGDVAVPLGAAAVDEQRVGAGAEFRRVGQELPVDGVAGSQGRPAGAAVADDRLGGDEGVAPLGPAGAEGREVG